MDWLPSSMFDQFNLGSLLTQITWIAVGIVGLVRRRNQVAVLVAETVAA